jgi:uncharacterized repeat protein (TIGR03803 family)
VPAVNVYINGTLVEQVAGDGVSTAYDKVGAYKSSSGTGPCTTTWENILFWTGGSANGGTPVVVDTPSFSPAAGTYTGAQTVTISSTTSGASIAYTMDGSLPTESGGTVTHGSLLSNGGTVSVAGNATLTALAFASGQTDSRVSTSVYIVNIPSVAAAPTFSPAAGTYATTQSVTITSATSGATINYTTDGSAPTESNGTVYSGPVSVSATGTLKAMAYVSGQSGSDSSVSSAAYSILSAAATPTFSPAAGTYSGAQTVTISTVTSSATIAFTTDGSTPSEIGGTITNGTLYSGAISIGATTLLKAIAFENGYADSSTASGTYAIGPTTATPTFSPAAGTYSSAQTVTIASATGGASIRYTTDGVTAPTETVGTLYSGPVTVSANATLQAIAYESGYVDSTVASATYTISLPPAATPTFSPGAGTYSSAQTVTISSTTSGVSIRYTTDGVTAPTETVGTLYSGPVTVSANATLQAIAYEGGYVDSTVASATYTISLPTAATPTFSPGAGTYSSAQTVTISSTTSGVSIRYTTDGSTPTETTGALLANGGTVSISSAGTTTLSAIAYESGYADSIVATGGFTITPPTVAPTFSTAAGTYSSAQMVTLSSTTAGATLRYTTDGSTPTETNGAVYSGPVSVSHSMILKTIAYEANYSDSAVTSAIYEITSSPAVILNVIYDFTGSTDGATPTALIQGGDSNFYGAAEGGGAGGDGTLFKITLTPSPTLTTLASFTGTNGTNPAGLIQGTDSNFYGTTRGGGSSNEGSIFKMTLTPSPTLTTLASFNGSNGVYPKAGLVQGSDGNFYGTTSGINNGEGTVFKMTLNPLPTLTTLASFNGSNGAQPETALVQGNDGNFYGTTEFGGSTYVSPTNPGEGTVFKMTLNPSPTLTALVSFTGANGEYPLALVQGSDSNFYGATQDGRIFKMTPAGGSTILVSFDDANGGDLVQSSDGNFYGTTPNAGSSNVGAVIKITPTGGLTTLVSFDGVNGYDPNGALVPGGDGKYYGTTFEGGASNDGVIFQLILPPVVAPAFSPAAGTYTSAQAVTITSATSGASIAYTTDGSTPTVGGGTVTHGTLYSGAVSISATTTLNAMAFESGFTNSGVSAAAYTIQVPSAPAPTPTPAAPVSSGGGGGGALDDWFFGFLALAGLCRWKRRKAHCAR